MKASESLALNDTDVKTSYSRFAMSGTDSMGEFTTGDDEIDGYIVNSGKRYGIDPLLIYSQMHQESSFKKKATFL